MTETTIPRTNSLRRDGRLRDPIWQFLSVVVTIAAIGVSLYSSYDVYTRSISSKQLEIEIAYSASIISLDEARMSKIELLYEGESISCASVVGLHIENTGNVPILPEDFVSPIGIRVPPPARIVATRVEDAEPHNLQPRFSQVQLSEIILDPLLLNPGDAFGVEMTVLELSEPDSASLAVMGRVVGIKTIALTPRTPESDLLQGLRQAYDTEAMIIVPLGTLVGFLLLWCWPKLWDWIERVFGTRPGSTWGRISLNLAIATLLAIALEDVIEGITEVAKTLFGG
jgi:hypothetical protein